MRYRKLASSDIEVSEISLGSWLTFSGGVAFEQTRACTDAAFAAGINFFDTANVYGRGAAEAAWGEILSGRPATRTYSRFHRTGTKGLHHPVVGELSLSYETMELPADAGLNLSIYTAEAGSASQQALDLLASLAATPGEAATAGVDANRR